MEYATSGPDEIAAAIAQEIGREVRSPPVATDGAARAAAAIAPLLRAPRRRGAPVVSAL